jgi:hypothetical protein
MNIKKFSNIDNRCQCYQTNKISDKLSSLLCRSIGDKCKKSFLTLTTGVNNTKLIKLVTNALAYFATASVMNIKSFLTLTTGVNVTKLFNQ